MKAKDEKSKLQNSRKPRGPSVLFRSPVSRAGIACRYRVPVCRDVCRLPDALRADSEASVRNKTESIIHITFFLFLFMSLSVGLECPLRSDLFVCLPNLAIAIF